MDDPFYWPSHGHHRNHHDHPDGGDAEVRVMEEVIGIIKGVLTPPSPALVASSGTKTEAQPKSAKAAFRETRLGISIPDLLHH